MLIHEFSNKDVTAEHVILAQAILAGTAQGDKSKAQRFMFFVKAPDLIIELFYFAFEFFQFVFFDMKSAIAFLFSRPLSVHECDIK